MKYIRQALISLVLFFPMLVIAGPLVNVNTADVHELTVDLIGMDENTAQAIVDYREKNGPFHTLEDLLNVENIGRDFLNINRDYLYLGEDAKLRRKDS